MLIGLYAAGRWEVWLTWRHGVPFNVPDPILGLDVGFYVFSLPFLQMLRGIGQAFVVLAALTAGGLYLVSGGLTSGFPAPLSMTPSARRHLSLLAAAFLLLLAWGAWLQRAEHLVETSGLLHGASYADVYGRMPAALVQSWSPSSAPPWPCCTRSDRELADPRGDRALCPRVAGRRWLQQPACSDSP